MWLIDYLGNEWIGKIFGGILVIMGLKETFFKGVAKDGKP